MSSESFGPAKGYFGPELKGFGPLNVGALTPTSSFWVLEDGVSIWLLEDGVSYWSLEQ